MIALWIILGICLFIGILLSFSLTVYVKITDEVGVWIGALGYKQQLNSDKPKKEKKEKKPKKAKEKKKTKKSSKEKKPKTEKANEKSFSDTVELAVNLIKSIVPNSVSMLKHLRIEQLVLYMTVAEEDADQTAISYGRISGGIYNFLGVLDSALKLKIKTVDIIPDFVTGEAVYDISFKVKLRFCHIIFAGFGILFKFLANTIKNTKSKPSKTDIKKEKAVHADE